MDIGTKYWRIWRLCDAMMRRVFDMFERREAKFWLTAKDRIEFISCLPSAVLKRSRSGILFLKKENAFAIMMWALLRGYLRAPTGRWFRGRGCKQNCCPGKNSIVDPYHFSWWSLAETFTLRPPGSNLFILWESKGDWAKKHQQQSGVVACVCVCAHARREKGEKLFFCIQGLWMKR